MNETKAGFSAEDAASAWDEGADAYEDFVETGKDYYRLDVHGPALLRACGDVRGCRVLDLGCGQGYFARELAHAGARVTVVDVSEVLIGHARRHEANCPLRVEYRVMDATRVSEAFSPAGFDLVTACMSLQDMWDPAAALNGAASLLATGSRFVFSVPNPTTDTPYREWERDSGGRKLALKIDRYFDSGPRWTHWNMPRLAHDWHTPRVHSTLSEITAMIASAGMVIRRIHEPCATVEQVTLNPKLEDCTRVPYFLVFDCVKQV